jgi:hypothetical protein
MQTVRTKTITKYFKSSEVHWEAESCWYGRIQGFTTNLSYVDPFLTDYGSILHETQRLNHALVAEYFLNKLIVAKVVKKFPVIFGADTSVPCSQELLTGPCLDPVHFNPYVENLIFLTLHFNTLASMLHLAGGM